MEQIAWTRAFALAWLVLLGGAAIGYAVVQWASRLPAEMIEIPQELLREAKPTPQMAAEAAIAEKPLAELFVYILGRNLSVYVWLLAGLLSAGAITFMMLFFNGISLGQTIGFAIWHGLPSSAIVDLLAPHGVLEAGTLCIAGAVGFQGMRMLREWSQHGWAAVKALRLGLVLAFGVVALTVAAGVESVVVADSARAFSADLLREG